MQIDNRTLTIAFVVATVLVAIAIVLTVRGQLRPAAPPVVADAEPITVPPEVTRLGGRPFNPSGPLVVAADDGLAVSLDCSGYRMQRTVVDGSATFTDLPMTGCALSLGAREPKPFSPVFPGDDLRCALDAEAAIVWCDNSLAARHAASVVAWSWGKGQVFINGELAGDVPVENIRLPIGRHKIEFIGERVHTRWPLTVQADEQIEIFFHAPTREGQVLSRRPASARTMPRQP